MRDGRVRRFSRYNGINSINFWRPAFLARLEVSCVLLILFLYLYGNKQRSFQIDWVCQRNNFIVTDR